MMGKGKSRVPINKRGGAVQREKQEQRAAEMRKAQEISDKVPVFNIYVRSPNGAKQWFQCGQFAGDESAKALVKAAFGGFMSGMYKDTLNKSAAKSVFNNE